MNWFTSRSLSHRLVLAAAVTVVVWTSILDAHAQRRGWREPRYSDNNPLLNWEIPENFKSDVFTFVRIEYDSYGRRGWGRGGGWETDMPDAEENFIYRLQQLTSLKVSPRPISMRLTNPDLFKYPFIYMVEPGSLYLSDPEVQALRKYLLNGGFLMVDDFWGEEEWYGFYEQIKKVFPDREPEELPLEHEIFHAVLPLTEKPQIPNVRTGTESQYTSITWEGGYDTRTPHYRGIKDDKGRLMAIICHNTDLGDGWEREGDNHYYFREFSEKKAYPLGINIVFYAMTH